MATMTTAGDGGDRREFRNALGRFAAELPRARGRDRDILVRQLHRLALASELHCAAEIVDGFHHAIAQDERTAVIGPWLAAIDQAAACGTADRGAASLLLATVGVHYA